MLEIILCIIGLVTFILGLYARCTVKVKNQSIENENKQLEQQHSQLLSQISHLQSIEQQTQEQLNTQIKEFENILNKQQSLSRNAFENYCDLLDKDYQEKEKEYQEHLSLLGISYEKYQLNLMQKTDEIYADLERIKATRAAAIQARIQEEKIKEQREFYMLCPKTSDIDDIKRLERIKPDLNNPRILSMLIWSTFFQKPMTTLCNNVLGTSTITGIYKITNQENEMCYIGQAADVAARWKSHAKCGLGIDTPAGNKLYKAMQEIGIWNFSWELLEECSRNDLDAKEKFYIDLYQSKDFGYNTLKGIS